MIQIRDHKFVNHKSAEQICWGCGFVIPRGLEQNEIVAFIERESPGLTFCGGAWHVLLAARPKCEQCGRDRYGKCEDGWLPPIGPCSDGSYITSRPCPNA